MLLLLVWLAACSWHRSRPSCFAVHTGRRLGDTAAELALMLATVVCREAGLMLELHHVAVHSLVPEPLQSAESPAAFMKALPEFDSEMDAQLQAAEAEDQCLRFVGE